MNGALLVAGTTSDAGKSVITAGLCRWLARQGLGFLLDDKLEAAAETLLTQMTPERYEAVSSLSKAADPDLFRLSEKACHDMVTALHR